MPTNAMHRNCKYESLLENLLFYSASSRTNYRIRYEINATGEDALTISDNVSALQKRGDAMIDTTLEYIEYVHIS